ncbi:MAG: metallophosphoesterase, partial [Clostridia bacterium]
MICATFILGACNDSSQTSSHSSDDTSSKTVSKSEESSNTTSESSKPTEPTDPMKDFKPVFRAVVCSDVHVSSYGSTEAKRFAQLFKSTYKYAENNEFYKKLDAIAVAGDFTNNGNANEYEAFNRVANENIKDETKLITVMGNHEYYGGGQPVYLANMDTVLDKDINVNGYHFIGLSPFNGNDYNDDQIKWLKEKLAAADAEDTNKPIFTFQHHHIQNTVYVAKTWYTGSSAKLNAAYKKYPQVLNFSGHSHGPINNPLSLFQKDYTLLGTGTLSYFEMETGMTGGTIPPNSNIAAQYYIIEVDAKNHVRILPYDLMTDTFFKTAASTDGDKQLIYSIDNLKDPSSFLYNNATRKTNATAPVFAEGITVDVSDVKINGAKISFKQADDDSCVYNYDVVCTPKNGGNKITQKFFSEYYFEPMPETVEYTISGLEPSTEYNIEVFAVNVWDKKSKPLTASITTKADVPVIYESINNVKYFGTFTNFDSIDKMLRSSSSFAYGGKVEGDYFAGDYASNTSYAVSDAAIAAG